MIKKVASKRFWILVVTLLTAVCITAGLPDNKIAELSSGLIIYLLGDERTV